MSRISDRPVNVPNGVEVRLDGRNVHVKGPKGELTTELHDSVAVEYGDGRMTFGVRNNDRRAKAMAATMRTIINNMVLGVSEGFERRLAIQGVGYRAQVRGNKLSMQLGFSHPVEYELPPGIQVEMPSQTEIIVKGVSKQLVGQTSAVIRGFRPPEPYKGKGVRYAEEQLRLKEAKKK